MNSIKKMFGIENKQENMLSMDDQGLVDEIRNVRDKMTHADVWFQMEEDSDLIEACIYRQRELKARYSYLIRQVKDNKITMSPVSKF